MGKPVNCTRCTGAGFGLLGLLWLASTAGCVAGTSGAAREPAPPTATEQEMLRRLDELETSVREVDEQVRRLNAELGAQLGDVQGQLATVATKVAAQERLLNRAATAMSVFGRQAPAAAPAGLVPQAGPTTAVLSPEAPAAGSPGVVGGAAAGAVAGESAPEASEEPPDPENLRQAGEPGTVMAEPSDEGQRRYETAYRDLQRENYQLALINFRSFLEEYPQTRLSDNAQYWIGEIFYAQIGRAHV